MLTTMGTTKSGKCYDTLSKEPDQRKADNLERIWASRPKAIPPMEINSQN